MNLRTYLDTAARGTAAALARTISVSPVMVAQWSAGEKEVPPARCVAIELATVGAVPRWDLRPDDWWKIWPELIGRDGAPEVPTQSEA